MSILMCYDGSPSSQHALEVAQESLSANELVLLYVWTPPAIASDSFSEPDPGHGPTDMELRCWELQRAQVITDEGRERVARSDLSQVTVRIERMHAGGVSTTIRDVAEELGSDLIVIGTHGKAAVERGLLGSVSGELARETTVPVLIAPSPDRHNAGSRPIAGVACR